MKDVMNNVGSRISSAILTQNAVNNKAPNKAVRKPATTLKMRTPTLSKTNMASGMPEKMICPRARLAIRGCLHANSRALNLSACHSSGGMNLFIASIFLKIADKVDDIMVSNDRFGVGGGRHFSCVASPWP